MLTTINGPNGLKAQIEKIVKPGAAKENGVVREEKEVKDRTNWNMDASNRKNAMTQK